MLKHGFTPGYVSVVKCNSSITIMHAECIIVDVSCNNSHDIVSCSRDTMRKYMHTPNPKSVLRLLMQWNTYEIDSKHYMYI